MTDFHELYTRYARDVHRFALYLSGDAALADDITSETFVRAWNSAAPIREATVHHAASGKFAIRKGDWVLIVNDN